jgi:hypothetical protein
MFIVQKEVVRTVLGLGPKCSCAGWLVKLNILLLPSLYIFSSVMFVINNLDNFKTNSLLHDFNTRSKNELHFLSLKLTSVKKGVTYFAIKIFSHSPSNIFH